MAKKIVHIGKKEPKIVHTGKTVPKINSEEVAAVLGAKIVGKQTHEQTMNAVGNILAAELGLPSLKLRKVQLKLTAANELIDALGQALQSAEGATTNGRDGCAFCGAKAAASGDASHAADCEIERVLKLYEDYEG
jgi:hypothetical protein